MEFHVLSLLFRAEGESISNVIDLAVAEAITAETLGYDGLWLGETQFGPDIGFFPPPVAMATHLLAKTSRIRIGTAISYLPLHHPLETAHFARGADQMSRGRFELGVGRGQAGTYGEKGYGLLEPEVFRAKFFEALEVLKLAVRDEPFSYGGEYYQFDEVQLTPPCYRDPFPLWGVAQSEATFSALGRNGYNIMIPIPGYHGLNATWEETQASLANYREAWQKAGHPGTPQTIVRFPCYVANTDSEAFEVALSSFETLRTNLGAAIAANPGLLALAAATGGFVRELERFFNDPPEDLLKEISVTGSPDSVIDRLQHIEQELAPTGVMLEFLLLGSTPRDLALRSYRLFAEKVMPKFK